MRRPHPKVPPHLLAPLLLGTVACSTGVIGEQPDPEDPAISIQLETDAEVVSGTVPVQLLATPLIGLREVRLLLDGDVRRRWESFPARMTAELDTFSLVDGTIRITAESLYADRPGAMDEVMLQVDNNPPTLRIEEPQPRAVYYLEDGPFTLEATVEDGSGIARTSVYVDDTHIEDVTPDSTGRISLDLDPFELVPSGTPGAFVSQIRIDAVDTTGKTADASVDFTIQSRLRWTFDASGPIETAPALLPDGTIVLGTLLGRVHVIESDGTERCSFLSVDEQVISSPVASPDGASVVWGTTRRLRSMSPTDCTLRWASATQDQWLGDPVFGPDGTIYATTFGGVMHAIDPATGADRWAVNLGEGLSGGGQPEGKGHAAVLSDGTVIQGLTRGATAGAVVAVLADGSVRWTFEGAAVHDGVTVANDTVYFGSGDGRLYALNADGERMWSPEPRVGAGAEVRCLPALLPDGAVVTCERGGTLAAYSADTGAPLWEEAVMLEGRPAPIIGGGVSTAPDGTIYVGDVLGAIHAHAADGVSLWTFRTPAVGNEAITSRVAVGDDTIYVGVSDQRLYALWVIDLLAGNGDPPSVDGGVPYDAGFDGSFDAGIDGG